MFTKIKRHIIVPFVFALAFFTLSGFDYSYAPASGSKATVEKASIKSKDTTSKKITSSSKSKNSDGSSTDCISDTDIPVFSGKTYIELNDNKPEFSDSEKITTAFENYGDLDSLSRCTTAYANICKELMPTEERGSIGKVKPTGWHTVKYNGLIDGNYLYNRCHLIAFCLAGENANTKNLITGTRYFNTVGMLPFETEVCDYVESTNNHVLYKVTPVFEGDNLVASGVQMQALSVEDNGGGICFNVFVYNVQPGIEIDYATGKSWINDSITVDGKYVSSSDYVSDGNDANKQKPASTPSPTAASQASDAASSNSSVTYILNTNTKKFHRDGCSSIKKMSEKNKASSNESRDAIIAKGYEPCQKCNP